MKELKASELRIGNYVRKVKDIQFSGDEIVRISSINKHGFLGLDLFKNYSIKPIPIDWIGPIELTEEWLIKMGFNDNILKAGHNDIIWYKDHIGIKGMLGIVKPKSVKYVHQLQNLYFILCGEELTIKN